MTDNPTPNDIALLRHTCVTCDELPEPDKLDSYGQCPDCKQHNPIPEWEKARG